MANSGFNGLHHIINIMQNPILFGVFIIAAELWFWRSVEGEARNFDHRNLEKNLRAGRIKVPTDIFYRRWEDLAAGLDPLIADIGSNYLEKIMPYKSHALKNSSAESRGIANGSLGGNNAWNCMRRYSEIDLGYKGEREDKVLPSKELFEKNLSDNGSRQRRFREGERNKFRLESTAKYKYPLLSSIGVELLRGRDDSIVQSRSFETPEDKLKDKFLDLNSNGAKFESLRSQYRGDK